MVLAKSQESYVLIGFVLNQQCVKTNLNSVSIG